MNLFLDIETIPTQRDDLKELVTQGIKPPGTMKKAETIEKWEKEQRPHVVDEAIHATGLDGAFGEIICIGYAFDDGPVEVIYRDLSGSEEKLLNDFDDVLADKQDRSKCVNRFIWIGHNITGFDLRFLWQRYVINQIRPAVKIPYDAKPWSDDVFDTQIEWAGAYSKKASKLDVTCQAMGFDGKGDLDGSKVWDYVKEGRIKEVVEYCKDDVEKTRLLYKRMNFK